MSAFKVQRSAVAKTAASSFGSIRAAAPQRKQSAGLAQWRTETPGCRGVLAVSFAFQIKLTKCSTSYVPPLPASPP